MLIFKTSKETINSVVENKKHAFENEPKDWFKGEIALICKNRKDCDKWEKQIKYIMIVDNIRFTDNDEVNRLWPGNRNRWNFIVEGSDVKRLSKPFNLNEVLGKNIPPGFLNQPPYIKLNLIEETIILKHLKSINAIE